MLSVFLPSPDDVDLVLGRQGSNLLEIQSRTNTTITLHQVSNRNCSSVIFNLNRATFLSLPLSSSLCHRSPSLRLSNQYSFLLLQESFEGSARFEILGSPDNAVLAEILIQQTINSQPRLGRQTKYKDGGSLSVPSLSIYYIKNEYIRRVALVHTLIHIYKDTSYLLTPLL